MPPRYDLSEVELEQREAALVRAVDSATTGVDVGVGWVGPDQPLADVLRTREAVFFPDIEGFTSAAVEARCRFVAVVDLEAGDLTHAFRVSSLRFGHVDPSTESSTGLPMVDEVVQANPSLTQAEVIAHYRARAIELEDCVAVETNFRMAASSTAPNGLRWSDYGYIAVFRELVGGMDAPGDRGVFAHLNDAARRSLGAVGIVPEPFAGRSDLRSPAGQEGTFDDRYTPAFLHADRAHVEVFRQLEPLAAPEVRLD